MERASSCSSFQSLLLYIASQKDFFRPTFSFHRAGVTFDKDADYDYRFDPMYIEDETTGNRIYIILQYSSSMNVIAVSMHRKPDYMLLPTVRHLIGFISEVTDLDLRCYPSTVSHIIGNASKRRFDKKRIRDVEFLISAPSDNSIRMTISKDSGIDASGIKSLAEKT